MRTLPVAALVIALGVSTLVAAESSADPADNTPGGAQVGLVRSPRPNGSEYAHGTISYDGPVDGPYTYTAKRWYDDAVVLTATGTRDARAYSAVGDILLLETQGIAERRVRIWDTSANPAYLLHDETLPCSSGGLPTLQVTPNHRYVAVLVQCPVVGSGGSNVTRFTRVLDVGTPAGVSPIIYTDTVGNIDENQASNWDFAAPEPFWSADYDEVIFTWGVLDGPRNRYATVLDLQTGVQHTWNTGAQDSPSTGTSEGAPAFTPCGSSFVTTATTFSGGSATGTTYNLRSTATNEVIGSYTLVGGEVGMDDFKIASGGTVDGRVAGRRQAIGTDHALCDEHLPTPVPSWPVGSMQDHPFDFAGGRTLTWPALAGDDRGIAGYEIVATSPSRHVIARVTGANTTSVVLPDDVPASTSTFEIFAMDAEGRHTNATDGNLYSVRGTPGPVPPPPPPPPPPATAPILKTMPLTWIVKWPTKYGVARVGRRVRVGIPTYSTAGRAQGLRASYRWYVGGRPVPGATSTRLLVRKAYRHKVLTVRVTITKAGYTSRSKAIGFGRVR